MYTKLIQLLRDSKLVIHRKRDALTLGAIPQSRVVEKYLSHISHQISVLGDGEANGRPHHRAATPSLLYC